MFCLPERKTELLQDVVIALLISVGASLCMSAAFFGCAPIAVAVGGCLIGCIAVFSGAFFKKYTFLPLLLLFSIEAALYAFFEKGVFFSFLQTVRAVILFAGGQENALLPYVLDATGVCAFILGLAAALFVKEKAFGASAILCIAIAGVSVPYCPDPGLLLLCALPVLAGTAWFFSLSAGQRGWAALPVALALLLLAFFVLPQDLQKQEPFSTAADTIRQDFEDHFFFTGKRDVFSLSSYGYMPNGALLGGDAQTDERPVLRVSSAKNVYLRAVSFDHYDGRSWTDTLGGHRYLYNSLAHKDERETAFDALLPYEGQSGGETVTVTLL